MKNSTLSFFSKHQDAIVGGLFFICLGFIMAKILMPERFYPPQEIPLASTEVSVVSFARITGDKLHLNLNGAVKLAISGKFFEGPGNHTILLSQIPNDNDLDLKDFPYVGNTRTKRLYPTDSYYARGTKPSERRFFRKIPDAIAEGFKPVKSLQ